MTIAKLSRIAVSGVVSGLLLLSFPSYGSAEESSSSPATAEFCSTLVQIETVLASSVPLAVLPPEVAEQVSSYQLSVVGPLFAKARETAPENVSEDVDTVATAITRALSTLDFSGTRSPDFFRADDNIDAKVVADCGFEEMSVTAVNYEYLGIPDTLPAGEAVLTLTNESEEVHEITVARINDGIDLSAEEILMLPEEESLASVTLVGYVAVPPGGTEASLINLDNGNYYVVCFTPEGTMSFDTPGEGPPHFIKGMLKEFDVE